MHCSKQEVTAKANGVPIPFSEESIVAIGWFEVNCFFGEGDKHTCLPDDCSETQLVADGPIFADDLMLFTVDPTKTSKPTCPGAAPAMVATASASTSDYLETTPTYYEGPGVIYAAAGSLYSRHGPFKSAPRSVWFQYV
jgi:hypothetical protein